MKPAVTDIRASVLQVLAALTANHTARVEPPPGAEESLWRWIDLVIRWNERMDLTAARSLAELCDLMVVDGAVLAASLPDSGSLIDVGTGAGAPGLAIALFRPGIQVTLVEPLAKRVAFLRTVIGTLRATNVQVIRGKGDEVLARQARYDVAVSRATLPPEEWLALGARLATARVDVLLAREEPPPPPAGWEIASDLAYTWPQTNAARRAVQYRRS